MHNSKLYDLAEPGLFRYSKPGCLTTENACNAGGSFSPVGGGGGGSGGTRCGEHGTCVGSLRQPVNRIG